MLLLAAKIGILASAGGQLSAAENATWQKLRTSVGVLARNGVAVGPAVFISADGYAVANTLVIQKGVTDLVTETGLSYKVKIEATDSASQLTLVKTTIRPSGITFVRAADRTDGEKGNILAVLPHQVLRAELTGAEKIGVDQKSKRTFPVQEIRVEQPALQMGGALLFSQSGNLIGGLFAALAQEPSNQQSFDLQGAAQSSKQVASNNGQQQLANRYLGPRGLVVGYSPTWEVTNKALVGFLTPEKKASYGLLGVFISDSKFGGVEIQSITKDSGAELAGLEVGDAIVDISGVMIRNQIDFSRATYRLIPGTTIPIQVRRKVELLTILVTVGSQHALADGHLKSSTVQFDFL
jgi:S1-C subfamily serine protease